MIVLDAAALVDLVLDQPSAPWVLEQIEANEVSAPAHQPAEVLSAIARLARAGALDEPSARDAIDEAARLPQNLVALTGTRLRRAYAMADRIRVLDGLYVTVADELGCPLVTTDLRLGRAQVPCDIRTPEN